LGSDILTADDLGKVMPFTESIIEDAALGWFGELGDGVGHGPHRAPGEPAAEREPERSGDSRRQAFGEVVLVGRLREAIRRLDPAIPEEARAAIKRYLKARFERRLNP
jgi:type I restriction enzyme R subunit